MLAVSDSWLALTDVLADRARVTPDARVYTFLADGEVEAAHLTFGGLERRARALAAELSTQCGPGNRALLLFPPGLEFIVAFFGCLYAGVIAVPAYPPRPRRDPARLRSLVRDAEPGVALTTIGLNAEIRRLAAGIPELSRVGWLVTDEIPDQEVDWIARAPVPEAPAFLQYTSGSTASPRGVIVSHANLLHNQRMISAAFAQDESSRVVGWLPLYHDMGLIGTVLQPLYCGGSCVLMSPMSFLQQPGRWLRAISRYGATTSGGPNFGYDLCVQRVGEEERQALDLSTWRVAFNGAEPVRAETLRRFAEAFAPCGFRREALYPCYGLAEATLFVTGGASGEPPRVATLDGTALDRHEVAPALAGEASARQLVGSGRPWMGQQVAIVDPATASECAPGRVGEVWISGPSVARGYWRQAALSERAFGAALADGGLGVRSKTFLRTGDLGFLLDGELFVTGRLKDLIILRGRNLYPQDLEVTAERSHRALRPGCGVAFSIDRDGEERLVLACEVERHVREAVEEIAGAVRRAIAEEHEAQVETVVLLRAGTLPRTTSGKVQRHVCRERYLAGELAEAGRSVLAPAAAAPPEAGRAGTPTSWRRALLALPPDERLAHVEERLQVHSASFLGGGLPRIDGARPLTELGLDSLGAIRLKHAVDADLGISPSLEDLLSGLSLAQASRWICETLAEADPVDLETSAPCPAEPLPETDAPLSHGQRSLWLLHRLAPESCAYNLAGVARLLRPVDASILRQAFQDLVDRHPALRTTYAAGPEGPVQRVREHVEVPFAVEDASLWGSERLGRRLREEAFRSFDLEHGPLLRVSLFTGGQAAPGWLLLSLHHIAADLWSVALMVRELGALYSQRASGAQPDPRGDGALQPAGYALWQEGMLAGPAGARLWEHWRERLDGVMPLQLYTDRPRPPVPSFAGGVRRALLTGDRTEALRRLARDHGSTLFMVLLAGFDILLARYSGQPDLVVGCPSTGRAPKLLGDRLSQTVGYFVNPLPLRVDLRGDPRVGEVLDRVRCASLAAFSHQDFPLSLLAERLSAPGRDRDPGHPSLFQVLFAFQKAPSPDLSGLAAFALGQGGGRLDLGDLELESIPLDSPAAQFDLTLSAAELSGETALALQFDSDLFDPATAGRILKHFCHLLHAMAAAPETRWADLELLGDAERWQLLAGWNDTAADYPRGLGLHQLFEAQARRTPAAVAVVGNGRRWSYGELAGRAERLAARLRLLGVGPEVRVGILCRRTPGMVAALLAVLEAGGTYVPLDPAYPAERLAFQLADSGVTVLLAHPGLPALVPGFDGTVVELEEGERDGLAEEGEPRSPVLPSGELDPERLAYVIYTSGSTGVPKGVAICHGSAVARVSWSAWAYRREHLAGVLAATSICFDLSVFELFVPLAVGGSILLAEDILALASLPAASEVTLINTVPSAMNELLQAGAVPRSVRVVNLAGEPLRRALAREILALPWIVELNNLYGPSEDTTYSTRSRIRRDDEREPDLGWPLANSEAYVLDAALQPVPPGGVGELWLGGTGLARGYLGRPELTADRFRPHPFAGARGERGARLYRTGDRARRRPSGQLEFLGRLDHQVKLRGYRIELEEIETALSLHPAVGEAAVALSAPAPGGEPRLVAYFVPHTGLDPAPADLQAFLARKLPPPMIPTAWARLERLPRTASGKVDRKALPEVSGERRPMPASELPQTSVEELLAVIWSGILGVERIGRNESFFALGGHSLLATQIAVRVRKLLGVDLPLRALFDSPTLKDLAARVESMRARGEPMGAPVPLVRAPQPPEQAWPLSSAQERLWFLDRLEPGSPAYNIGQAVRITGPLDMAALAGSLLETVRRHDSLRTSFLVTDRGPVQMVGPRAFVPMPCIDLRSLPADRAVAMASALAREEARSPFDLERGPLLRLKLLRLGNEEHLLLLTLHHAVTDGWSMGVLVRELSALYPALLRREPASLPELPIQYGDYAVWQRSWLTEGVLASQLDFWRRELQGAPTLLDLPLDRPRPARRSFHGASLPAALPVELSAALRSLGRREGLTPFMLLLTCFGGLLARYTGQQDLLVGAPIAGRNRAELEPLIGLFLNTLPMRLDLSGDPDFLEAARRVRETTLAAHSHQELPFERLVEELSPVRSLSHAPLLQAMLVLQPATPSIELPGLRLSSSEIDTGATKLDLTLSFAEDGGRFAGRLTYSSELFHPSTAARLLGHFEGLLSAALSSPSGRRLAELPMVTGPERAQLLVEWNDTWQDEPELPPVHRQLEDWARRTPERPALIYEGLEITYGALDRRANALAGRLRAIGVGPGSLVALVFERSPDMVTALLATLKAGAAYVPLDPESPPARLEFLRADSGAALTLDQAALDEILEGSDGGAEAGTVPAVPTVPGSLAYVVYTSGSTGRPKGVAIGHLQLSHYVREIVGRLDLAASKSFAMVSTFAADLGNTVLFPALTTGGCLHLVSRERAADAEAFAEYLTRHSIDCLKIVPSHLVALQTASSPERALPRRHLILGGEATTRGVASLFQARRPGCEIFNHYGPTETTVGVATSLYRPDSTESEAAPLPLGRPLPGTELYLLDAAFQPVPVGIPGELYIGGSGLAFGYLRRPELTAECFLPNPFRGSGARLYRSGDLARRRSDGQLEFLGRADDQVKLRGFRVEPAEVAVTLRQHPAVREAEALVRTNPSGERCLVAYVVAEPAGSPGADRQATLREFLAARLPEYMLPAPIVELERLPLTANGKIDRRALPDPDWAPPSGSLVMRTPTEEIVAGIWCEVLGLRQVGASDDFFALGGHSLRATQVQSRLRSSFGIELPLRILFEEPTVAGLAAEIDAIRRAALAPPAAPIQSRDHGLWPPLSFAQERLWFLDQLASADPTYNLAYFTRVAGPLAPAVLLRALREVLRRHAVLRATFEVGEGRPRQRIAKQILLELPVVDLRALPAALRQAEWRRLAEAEAKRPFELARGPLLRSTLLALEADDHVFLLTLHHIVSDAWSRSVLSTEIAALYAAFAAGTASPLDELPIQYADYAAWQREWLQGEVLAAQLRYWKERFPDPVEPLQLSADRPYPAARTPHGGAVRFHLPGGIATALGRLASETGTTTFMVLLAVYATLLERYSGQPDLVIGTPIANRTRREIEALIGFFVNTLALRLSLTSEADLTTLLAQSREVTLGAYDHQDLPFEQLVEALATQRSLDRSPLVQTVLSLQNAPAASLSFADLRFAPIEVETGTAKFDLTLDLTVSEGGLDALLRYSADLFDKVTIERMASHFGHLLTEAIGDPGRQFSSLSLLSRPETQQLIVEWSDTRADQPPELILHRLVERQVERTPEAVAVEFEGELLSYRQLDQQANHLAYRLRTLGVGPEVLVGICARRSLSLPVALLAVSKAGGAYVPLDPEYPEERLSYMLSDSGASVLIAEESLEARLAALGGGSLHLVTLTAGGGEEALPPEVLVLPEHPAYAIYTSGSTGRPKGAINTHGGITNRLLWMQSTYGLQQDDRVLQKTPFSFDVSVWEFFWPLMVGARLVMARPGGHQDPSYLLAMIAAQRITTLHFVPSMLQAFLEQRDLSPCRNLRRLLVGGESLAPDLAWRLLTLVGRPFGVDLFSRYGPTEAAILVTNWRCDAVGRRGVPIGRPVANTRIHLLDRRGLPVPVGVPGELHIGGAGLARGYLHQPDLTAERFVPNPFAEAEESGSRLYRTGDLARYWPNGEIEHLGRLDQQVKIRGHRIELGEIEAALASHPQVERALVVVREVEGERALVAYLVARGEAPAAAELRRSLGARLPAYMLPAAFMVLPAMPLLPNGKIDPRALPAPRPERAQETLPGIARTAIEEIFAGIWGDVLALPDVGAEDDFFALGGHSLQAVRVCSRVREVFGVELPIRWLFETASLAALTERFELALSARRVPVPPLRRQPRQGLLPLSYAQARLWFLAQLAPESPFYNMHSVLRLTGPLDVGALERSCREIVWRHEVLRTTYPTVAGSAVQRIEEKPLDLPLVDLSGLPAESRETVADRLAEAFGRLPFDLARSLPLRVALLRLSPASARLLIDVHHIASDGWSHGRLHRELLILYETFSQGLPSPLPELPLQYADYAIWQRERLSGEGLAELLSYWRDRLDGAPSTLDLPTDHPRPAEETFRGADVEVEIDAPLATRIRAAGRRFGATTFMTALAAWKALLARYTGRTDLVVGTATANRGSRELEELIGFFVNVLVLRTDLSGNPSFEALLERVREVTLGSYAYQDLPFERLVDEMRVERSLRHNPLCQVLLVFQNLPLRHASARVGELCLEPLAGGQTHTGTAKFDLVLVLWDGAGGGLGGHLQYNSDLFERATILRLWRHFETLLAAAVAAPASRLTELELMSEPERHQLLAEWDRPSPCAPSGSIHQALSRIAAVRSAAPAVSFEERSWSYGELDRQSNRLARTLRRLGVGPEVLVGIVVERSFELVMGALGVLKAGGAYVPLDPAYPSERLAWLRQDAGVTVLLTETRLREIATGGEAREGMRVLCLDDDGLLTGASAEPLDVPVAPESLAYVIYTSGSTGRPKGVQVTHGNVLELLAATEPLFGFGPDDIWTLFHSFSFDFSVWEIWGALLYGGRLVVVPYWVSRSPEDFHRLLATERVTVLNQTPSAFRQLIETDRDASSDLALRWVIFGGEALDFNGLRPWLEKHGDAQPQMINMYGITETTVHVTFRRVLSADLPSPGDPGPMSGIGRPLAHLATYVLDASLQMLPVGVPGELAVGGGGVARGYLGRPDLTAERFVPDPWSGLPGGRLYRSGDLGMRLGTGELVHLGRIDHQVKIRGFRIELGEVEAVLRQAPWVQEAVALAREEKGERQLVAYVVMDPGPEEGAGEAELVAQVKQWEQVFDSAYSRQSEAGDNPAPPVPADPTFDIRGWDSSYTGEPIPAEEMREWVERTVERIASYTPRRVLEIGCGTGLLLFRIAPQTESYVGWDLSEVALAGVRTHFESLPGGLGPVRLEQRAAHDFSGVEPGSVDAVVLNSVAQYFPSFEYLLMVLERAATAVSPGGFIFMGDVRSLPLLEAFHASVELERTEGDLPLAVWRERIRQRALDDEELVLAPGFFLALANRLAGVDGVEILPKRSRYNNELTRFRYDVVIHVGPRPGSEVGAISWMDWETERLDLPSLRYRLAASGPPLLGLRQIPNARLAREVSILRRLAESPDDSTVGRLRQAVLAEGPATGGIDPEELWTLAEEHGYELRLSWAAQDAEGRFDALFADPRQGWQGGWPAFPTGGARSRPWRVLANQPLRARLLRGFLPQLQAFARERLPEHMLPGAYVLLDRLPLTAHGKVDRRALPAPDRLQPELGGPGYRPPSSPLEVALAEVWGDVLGVGRVGLHDAFFDLGGDSIKAVRLISRVNERLSVKLKVQDAFRYQSVAAMAGHLATGAAGSGDEERSLGRQEIARLQQSILADPDQRSRLPEEREDFYPLSGIERGMIFHSLLAPDEPVYYDQLAYLFEIADLDRFYRGFELLVDRHAIFRSRYYLQQFEEPMKVVAARVVVPRDVEDLTALEEGEQRRRVQAYSAHDLANRPGFAGDLLWRLKLFRLRGDLYCAIWSFHHAILDGWSNISFWVELDELVGRPGLEGLPRLTRLASDYRDYVEISLGRRGSSQAEAFWREHLAGHVRNQLPFSRARARGEQGIMQGVRRGLSDDLFDRLRSQASAHHLSLQALLVSAHLELLRIIVGEDDLVTGIVTHDRPGIPDGDKIIGCFLNSVPLRVDMTRTADVRALVHRVHDLLNEQKRHQLPLVDIATVAGPRATQGNPFFDTLFNFTDFHVTRRAANNLLYRWADDAAMPAAYQFTSHLMTNTLFDVEVSATTRGKMNAGIKYAPQHFDAADVERAIDLYVRVLERFALGLEGRLSAEALLSTAERQEIVVRFNDTAVAFDRNRGLYPLSGEVVAASGDRPAVVCAGQRLDYVGLDLRVRRLAAALRVHGVRAGDRVGLICARSVDLAVAALAVLAADASYVPMEPDYPPARKGYIAGTSGLRRIVADRPYELDPPLEAGDLLVIGEVEVGSGPLSDPGCATGPDDLAYTIYTSGSTGRPKGVMIQHGAAANLVQWVNRELAVGPGRVLLMLSSICFDLSVYDLFGGLAAGATVVIAELDDLRDPRRLGRLMVTEGVTFWSSVPSTMTSLVQYLEDAEPGFRHEPLQTVLLSGDWIPLTLPNRIRRFFPAAKVISLGGATEATVWSNFYPVQEIQPSWVSIPYGRPIANSSFYILDRGLDLVPAGVVGELFIGGVGTAVGYAADPEKTAAAFLPDRFAAAAGSRMYRTGDLGRMMADGNIEFLGRVDHQVKIRGFRVELGEIEAQLLRHSEVRAAAVAARDDKADGKYLCAYFVSPDRVAPAELRRHLAETLPEYMIPTVFVPLEELPLSPNGKLDRRALPAPALTGFRASVYRPPTDPLEAALVEIWEKVLGIEGIGTGHDFFELGGHSLSAVQVITQVRRRFEADLPLRSLFDSPTVGGLAAVLRELGSGGPLIPAPPSDQEISDPLEPGSAPVPLSFAQERFWFLQQFNPESSAFNMKVSVHLSGVLDLDALRASFAAMLQRHPVLRANFHAVAGKPVQTLSAGLLEVPLLDLSALEPQVRAALCRWLATESADRPFDLARERLLRVCLIRLAEREHVAVLTLHHIVGDGWSVGILCRELADHYNAFSQGLTPIVPELPVHYWDFARRQRQALAGAEHGSHLEYWRRRLAGELPVLELPLQKQRPLHPAFRGAARRLRLPARLSEVLNRLGQQQGATLFMTLLAAFKALLHLYTGQEDLVIGTNTANREDDRLMNVIGAFVNNLVLRTDLAGNPTFRELLARVRDTALEAYAHQDLPYEILLEQLRPSRDAGYVSLFQVMFVLQSFPSRIGDLPGLTMSAVDLELRTANFDLVVMLAEREEGISGSIIYDTELFTGAAIERMADDYERLLRSIVSDPGARIQSLEIADQAEVLEIASVFSGDL